MSKKIILALVIGLFAVTGCGNKKLTCKMSDSANGMDMTSIVNVTFDGDKMEKVEMIIDITIPDEYKDQKDEFIEQYKKLAGEDTDVSETSDGIRIKMVGNEDNYEELGIKDTKVSLDELKKELTDMGYEC